MNCMLRWISLGLAAGCASWDVRLDAAAPPQRHADGSFTITIPHVEQNDVRILVAVTGDGDNWAPA